MDPGALVAILGSIAGIIGFLYFIFLGQKALPEILRDRKAGATSAVPSPSTKMPPVRHNLPQPDYGNFVDRLKEIAQIRNLLSPASRHFLIVIEGFAGVGKTALALVVAQDVLATSEVANPSERFAAIAWTSAKTKALTAEGILTRETPQLTRDDVITTIAVVLQREEITRAKQDEQVEVVRTILAQTRVLLIIDSFETVSDTSLLTFLRELPAPSKAIITSRQRLDVSFPIRLTALTKPDAQQLIEQECLEKGVVLTNSQKDALSESTSGIPVAIVWSIARIAFGFSADTTVKRLAGRDVDKDLVQFCFDGVTELVRGRDEFNILMSLAVFAGDASTEAISFVTGIDNDGDRLDRALVHLMTLSLVSRPNENLVSTLNLTRSFAGLELEKSGLAIEYRSRVVEYYRALSSRLGSADTESEQLLSQVDNIRFAMDQAYDLEAWNSFISILLNMSRLLYLHGSYTILMEFWDRLIRLNRFHGEPEVLAKAARVFADGVVFVYLRNDRGEAARTFLQTVLPDLRSTLDLDSLALVTQRLGILSRHLAQGGDYSAARTYLEESRKIAASIQPENQSQERARMRRLADTLNGLGSVAILEGEFKSARRYLAEADELLQSLGDSSTRSSVARHLAEIERKDHRLKEASRRCETAIRLAESSKRDDRLADALSEMALIALERGDREQANGWFDKARAAYVRIGAFSDAKRIESLLG